MKQDAMLEKDYQAEQRAWARRMLLAPAQERWKSQPWAAEASALIESALEQAEKEFLDPHALSPLANQFRELMQKAPDEPLVLVFGARAVLEVTDSWREPTPPLEKVLSRSFQELGGALECLALHTRWLAAEKDGVNKDAIASRWAQAAIRSLGDGSYDEATHVVLLRQHLVLMNTVDFTQPGPLEGYGKAVEAAALPDWLKLTLRGIAEKELGWVKRSSGWADRVTDQQWKGFAEHLKSARELLGQAARLRPDRPEAATSMIAVAMGESVDPSEIRAWFDRAVGAQFDYQPAYTSLLWAYRPRWGGSHERMLAFGKACAETRRYDTRVPSLLMTAAMNITEEIYSPQPVFRHDQVRAAISTLSRGYLEAAAAAPPLTRHLRQSDAALCAWLADDDALAAQALAAAGPRLHRGTRSRLHEMFLHESLLRAEVEADTGAYGEAVRAAASPAPDAKVEDIHAAFLKVDEKGLSDDALEYVREAREFTGLQKAVEAGGWVSLPFRRHLTAFLQPEEGDWSVDKEGCLVSRGTDHPRSRLLLRVPLGPDIEMKGEIALDMPAGVQRSRFGHGFGPLLHWLPDCVNGLRVMIIPIRGDQAATKAWCASPDKSTRSVDFRLQEWNTFSVRTAGGKITYEVNGRTVATRDDMARLGLEVEAGLIGFNSYRMPPGSTARVRNVSLRKINAAALAPAAVPALATVSTAASGLPDWTWKAAGIFALLLLAIFIPRLMPKQED